jgi:hypothetical protein
MIVANHLLNDLPDIAGLLASSPECCGPAEC